MIDLTNKFRVWDEENKHFLEPAQCLCDGNGRFCYVDSQGMKNYWTKDFKIERCAGLMDKNRELIFEGDWVRNDNGKVGYVAYLAQEAGFVVVYEGFDCRLGHHNTGSQYDIEGKLEVVGNIHEMEVER